MRRRQCVATALVVQRRGPLISWRLGRLVAGAVWGWGNEVVVGIVNEGVAGSSSAHVVRGQGAGYTKGRLKAREGAPQVA